MEIAERALSLALASEHRYAGREQHRRDTESAALRGDLWKVDTPDRIRKRLDHLTDAAGPLASEVARSPEAEQSEAEDAVIRLSRERAIGDVDLVTPRYLQLALSAGRCVGRITVKTPAGKLFGYGTGWLVAPGILLTNHHVLESEDDASASEVVFGFDSQDPTSGIRTARLEPKRLFVTDVDLDFTFVGVAMTDTQQKSLSDLGCLSLNSAEGKVINREFVTLVQYPSGGPKMFALRENRVVDVLDDYLHYVADTAPGSSGSPVMNDQFEVVALHHTGVPARDGNGRVLNIDGNPWTSDQGETKVKWIANEGIRVSRLVARAQALAQGTPYEALLKPAWDVATSIPRFERASVDSPPLAGTGQPTFDNGQATWTIPLQVTVKLGHLAPGSGERAAPIVVAAPANAAPPPAIPDAPQAELDTPALAKAVALARDVFKSIPGIMEIRSGWRFVGGWITNQPAVVVVVREKLTPSELAASGTPALPDRLHGYPVEVRQASAEELVEFARVRAAGPLVLTERESNPTYQPPAGLSLPRIKKRMQVTAHVSPEAGWQTLKQFLEGTQKRLTVGMYDFGAPHIRDALTSTLTDPKSMRLLIQFGQTLEGDTKKDDLRDDDMVAALASKMRKRFDSRWVSVSQSGSLFASAYHIKVAVRDHTSMWLSSGNWQSSNQPPEVPDAQDTPGNKTLLETYNREWHIVLSHPELPKVFEQFIDYDYEQSDGFVPKGADQELYEVLDDLPELEEATSKRVISVFPPLSIDREVDVQAVLSPDNYVEVVLAHLKSATRSMYFQNQYINESKDPRAHDNYVQLVRQLAAKQKAGLDVRIILRKDTGVEARHLEFMKSNGIDVDLIRWRNKSHTKGIIVDGERVLIGSHNWSFDGVKLNRDASLLFYDKELAQYFQKVFLYDWENWTTSRPPIRQVKPKVEELSSAQVQELGEGLVARPLLREY